MEQNIKKIGAVNLLVLLAVGISGVVLARYTNSLAGQAGMVFLGLGFLVLAISYFQMRLEEGERLEKLEFDEMTADKASQSLFSGDESEVFPARRSREQFERFFVPGFTVVLFLLQAGAAIFLWRWLDGTAAPPLQQPMVALALFSVFFLILFLVGKYSASLARFDNQRLLRPGSNFVVLSAYITALITISIGFVWGGFPNADLYLARILAVLLGFMAFETLLSLIFEIYRPRVKGKAAGVLYESRFVGVLAQPESLVSTAAHAIDYQFGFKVSDTWFYRFLQRALGWLILVQVGILFLSTSFLFVAPGEQALIERFGRPVTVDAPLQPGLRLKLPWPIDQVHRYRADEIQTLHIGFVPHDEHTGDRTITWTVGHYEEEFNFLVASRDVGRDGGQTGEGVPADMLSVSIPVQFQIDDLHAWAYNHTDAAALLEKVATREVVRYLVGVDLFEIMSSGRNEASADLQERIQGQADRLNLGVRIIFVGLQDIHPPVQVAAAFQEIIRTVQRNEASRQTNEAHAVQTKLRARAEAANKIRQAKIYANQKVTSARAQAAEFANQMAVYEASPQVFLTRAYLDALERGAADSRKYILGVTNSLDVINLNLEDKIRPDFLDIPLPNSR